MPDHAAATGMDGVGAFLLVLVLVLVSGVAYRWAARAGRGRRWPRHRLLLWVAGALATAAAVTGPLAEAAHHRFTAHMVTHLLLGMVAPLLLVLAAPLTVLLRALPVQAARVLSRVLRSLPLRVLADPVVAAVLNVGGLWALYTTGLYGAMHVHPGVHLLVHLHVFLTGYLFTAAVVGIDPMPHRRSFRVRAVVLVAALAAHDILAKYLYAHPPVGVPDSGARTGAMLMYYGGDAVDVALMVLLWARWYRVGLGAGSPTRRSGQVASAAGPAISVRRAR